MGRIEVVVYECDWCKDREPADTDTNGYTDEEPPKDWKEVDHAWLCKPCQDARSEAISDARFRRLNKAPPLNESEENTNG